MHLAPNIRVNCIIPGGILSNQSRDFVKKYSNKTLLKRMMKVKEINGVIKFLCLNESSYCAGAEFVLDGGYTIKN